MISLSISWWMIPSIVSIVGVWWALFWVGRNDTSLFSGLGSLLALVPVLLVSCVSWIIAGVLK